MTEKEMMKQMQDLLGIRKKPSEKEAAAIELADSVDELAEMFCDSAIVLSRISSLLQRKKNPWDTKNFEDIWDWPKGYTLLFLKSEASSRSPAWYSPFPPAPYPVPDLQLYGTLSVPCTRSQTHLFGFASSNPPQRSLNDPASGIGIGSSGSR